MDFRLQTAAPAGLADVDVDALVLVIGERPDRALAKPLAGLVEKAVSEGDLVLKKGKALYLYQPAGVASPSSSPATAPGNRSRPRSPPGSVR